MVLPSVIGQWFSLRFPVCELAIRGNSLFCFVHADHPMSGPVLFFDHCRSITRLVCRTHWLWQVTSHLESDKFTSSNLSGHLRISARVLCSIGGSPVATVVSGFFPDLF